jgi:hypothetical protein
MLDSGVRPLGQGEGKSLSVKYGVRFLGELPIDPKAAEAADLGDPRSLLKTDFSKCLSTSLRKADLLKTKPRG